MSGPIRPLSPSGAPLPRFVELDGRVALVTGGDRGIGRAIAEAFAAQGMRVAVTLAPGTVADAGLATALAEAEPAWSAHHLDLRSGPSIDACVAEVMARWGRLDVVVNNAAVGSATVARFADEAGTQDTAMMLINADGTLKMCQAVLAATDWGANGRLKVVNMSSVGGGVTQFPGFRLSDGMSKAAVAHLTRQLAAECVHRPVDVFAVCPGATNTAMFQASTLDPMGPDERAAFVGSLPRHRLIEPDEIAALITFLACDHSAVLHGAVLDASLGLGVRPGIMTEQAH